MTHSIEHIICGSAGAPAVDKVITVYDAPFSVAIKVDVNALEAAAIAAGMSPAQARRRADRFLRLVEADWYRWGDYLEEKLCLEYTRHEPHAGNHEPHG